ncbi:MAG: SRPBCC family protein [Alphaproteobacteria bacterium]|nr:MAG: SRPBCC family protein [Alphaproteobacteria bacterium]
MVQDRFRDWNLLHKSVAALVAAFFVAVAIHAVRVREAAFALDDSRVLPYSAETIWPWLTDYRNRARWQAELIDLSRMSGDVTDYNSTRLLFWKRRYTHWQAVEQTKEIVENRLFATIQESDFDYRWFRIELEPVGPCSTRVTMHEVIQPLRYTDRFWFFRDHDERRGRLTLSLDALDDWLGKTAPACAAGAPQE